MRGSFLSLLDPAHPLLVRLRTHAPGTYVHSLLVGQMAAFAAAFCKNIDPLLALVGGLYHDVGKIFRSHVYAENAFLNGGAQENFTKNQAFIAAHPQRSLALAKRYKMPPAVQAFMVSHHGTTLAFTHSKSLQQRRFRYPGPKPRTMEEALVMLADSCEASFRAAASPWRLTPAALQNLFVRVIQHKVAEGQLSEVRLTSRMLRRIAQRFALFIAAFYHTRQT